MFLSERFYNQNTSRKLYSWNQCECYKLKYKYKHEHAGDVITYKLSEEEMKEYLKKFNK